MPTSVALIKAFGVGTLIVALMPVLGHAQQQAPNARAQAGTGASFDQIAQKFQQWLAVQEIYPKSQVPAIQRQFTEKARSLSGPELQTWLDGMEAKLRILSSPEAAQARQWLSYFASPSVVLPERTIQSFDIINNTPAQVQQALDQIDARRQGRATKSQAFNAVREQQVQQARSQMREQERFERQQLAQRSVESSFPTGGQAGHAPFSPYAPQQRARPELRKGPSMYVSPWGGVGFILNQ